MTSSLSVIAEKIIRRRECTRVALLEFAYDSHNSPFTISEMYKYLERVLGEPPIQLRLGFPASEWIKEMSDLGVFRQDGIYYSLIPAEEQVMRSRRIFG